MNRGLIIVYSASKRWGFIKQHGGKEYFFHANNSPDFTPELGITVEFEIAAPFKLGQRDQAVKLRKVESVGTETVS